MTAVGFDPTGTGLVVGTIVGQRSWNIEDGRLHPLHQRVRTPWEDGENVATCWALGEFVGSFAHYLLGRGAGNSHKVASWHCGCGFHAYHSEKDQAAYRGDIDGIIEGYGRVTVGSKGFRSEKARIVALVARPFPYQPFVLGAVNIGLAALLIAPNGHLFNTVCGVLVTLIGAAEMVLGVIAATTLDWIGPIKKHRLKRNYPSVRFFKNMVDARKAFPLTGPVELSREGAA